MALTLQDVQTELTDRLPAVERELQTLFLEANGRGRGETDARVVLERLYARLVDLRSACGVAAPDEPALRLGAITSRHPQYRAE